MNPDQQHRCMVQLNSDGAPYLAFEPFSGERSSFSNSLFTLDLRPGVTLGDLGTATVGRGRLNGCHEEPPDARVTGWQLGLDGSSCAVGLPPRGGGAIESATTRRPPRASPAVG